MSAGDSAKKERELKYCAVFKSNFHLELKSAPHYYLSVHIVLPYAPCNNEYTNQLRRLLGSPTLSVVNQITRVHKHFLVLIEGVRQNRNYQKLTRNSGLNSTVKKIKTAKMCYIVRFCPLIKSCK